MMIVNEDSRVVTKLETSLTDDARVVFYNHHTFIARATDYWTCQPTPIGFDTYFHWGRWCRRGSSRPPPSGSWSGH